MPWAIKANDGQQICSAPVGQILYIIQDSGGLSVVRATPDDPALVLGALNVQTYGAKLEAGNDDLKILPSGPARPRQHGNGNPVAEGFLLRARTDARVETTVIRDQDTITSANGSGALTLIWTPPQIQVQSSEKKGSQVGSAEVDRSNDETEEDEDLDNAVVPHVDKSQNLRSTPHMSASHSVIQETPTAVRIGDAVGLPSRSIVNDLTNVEEPSDEDMEHGKAKPEVNDTVLRKSSRIQHPQVQVPKRPSPAPEEGTASPTDRTPKRRKVDLESDTNSAKATAKSARKTATKTKGRESAVKAESTPFRSQRSTESPITGSPVDVEGDYDGPKPRVLLSNSTIQPNSSFVKFLKKHGGSLVSVEGDCNILCTREGPVLKTPKILNAIARGTPVVTDNWLLDSAKTGRFLPLDLYKPPDLEPVWKIPQSRLFEGHTICFTPSLKVSLKGVFADLEKLCKSVGARRVVSKKPGGKDLYEKSTIFLAEAEGDKDVSVLLADGHTCYTKDFLTHSIMVGEVDVDSDEFKVMGEEAQSDDTGDETKMEDTKPAKPVRRTRGRNG